jgi:8-oxo-dGTP diphosphatase
VAAAGRGRSLTTDSTHSALHVVAGILRDGEGRILLAQRPAGTHLAGTWEFPGGKIETGESAEAALRRELHEELGVDIGGVEPLISVPWRYPQKSVVLHAFSVVDFRGEAHGRERQKLRWVLPGDALGISMPPPDWPILSALRLPPYYAITPEPGADTGAFLAELDRVLANGVSLIQLRAKHLADDRLHSLATAALRRTKRAGAALLLNGHIGLARQLDVDGVHLPAVELMRLNARPLERTQWVGASCHDAHELAHAAAIGVDFAVLGPVQSTSSHMGATPLGWRRFREFCAIAPLPVYALGGMGRDDLQTARAAGAQGIAGISAFWPRR